MIHEWRSYRLKPGAAAEYLGLLADRGLPLVTRHLPLMGYWLAESGRLNCIHHLWTYADWEEREARRTALAQEEDWTRGFVPAAFALVEEQENRLMQTLATSAEFDAAVARRLTTHPARSPGAALFAGPCAALVEAEAAGAVAVWQTVSGRPGPLSLMPRGTPQPAPGTILRPLAFSPL